MPARRTFDGVEAPPMDQSMAEPATLFDTPDRYTGRVQQPQRRNLTGDATAPAAEGMMPQYIPPATMEQLFRELTARR